MTVGSPAEQLIWNQKQTFILNDWLKIKGVITLSHNDSKDWGTQREVNGMFTGRGTIRNKEHLASKGFKNFNHFLGGRKEWRWILILVYGVLQYLLFWFNYILKQYRRILMWTSNLFYTEFGLTYFQCHVLTVATSELIVKIFFSLTQQTPELFFSKQPK